MPHPTPDEDRAAIRAHIDGLFRAYFRGDREAIRRSHTADWTGFQIASRTIVRGIDEYMRNADEVLAKFSGYRYELEDLEILLQGDRAVVFYVAREWLRDADGNDREILLRSIDLYRREVEGWNQYGSHIGLMP